MNGSGHIIDRLSDGARCIARWDVSSRASRFVKALLVAVVLFAGAPISASHANAHCGPKSQIAINAINAIDVSIQGGDTDSTPFGGIEHHFCYSPCLEAFPSRASYVTAYLEGTRVRYPAYFDVLGATRDPDPLRKPPRFSASA